MKKKIVLNNITKEEKEELLEEVQKSKLFDMIDQAITLNKFDEARSLAVAITDMKKRKEVLEKIARARNIYKFLELKREYDNLRTDFIELKAVGVKMKEKNFNRMKTLRKILLEMKKNLRLKGIWIENYQAQNYLRRSDKNV